jgi:hypothetical protein
LLQKYNALNAINVDFDEVVFEAPVVSNKPGYNTSVTFKPKLLSKWLSCWLGYIQNWIINEVH